MYAKRTAVITNPITASITANRFCLSTITFTSPRISASSASLRYPFPSLLSPLVTRHFFSLPLRGCLPRFFAVALRHSFIRSRRLLQQLFPRLHLRARDVLRRLASLCSRLAFARHSPLVTRHFPQVAPQRLPRQRLELLQARQLLQVAQSKPHQEFLRRLVQNRPPHHFLAPRRGNQVLVQQRADHPRSVHPAYLRNLRRRNRLLVGDHRQRFQRRHGQPQRRPQALDEPPHHVVVLWLGVHLVPARYRADFDSALFRCIARHQFIQRRLHRQLFFAKRVRELFDRRRLIRRVNNRFQRRSSLFVRHRKDRKST